MALLGTVTLEVALVARYWTWVFFWVTLLSYFLVYPYIVVFPWLELASTLALVAGAAFGMEM